MPRTGNKRTLSKDNPVFIPLGILTLISDSVQRINDTREKYSALDLILQDYHREPGIDGDLETQYKMRFTKHMPDVPLSFTVAEMAAVATLRRFRIREETESLQKSLVETHFIEVG